MKYWFRTGFMRELFYLLFYYFCVTYMHMFTETLNLRVMMNITQHLLILRS